MRRDSERFVALVGFGYWGKNILRNLDEVGVLHTACDTDSSLLAARQAMGCVRYTGSFEEVLSSPEIKAVAIATPASSHYRLAKEAMLAGKDVFVEKPLAMTTGEGEELLRISREEERVLMVGHILHYHPAVKKLKGLISCGALGKIQYIYSNRLNIGKLRTEENILWSFAPHDISVILMLLDEEPVRVSAFGGAYLNSSVYDTTMTALEFRNGVKAHIFVSWLHPYKEQKLIVVGSEAMAVFDDVSEEKLFIYPHEIEWRGGTVPVVHKADCEVVPVEKMEPLRVELEHFIACVNGRGMPRTDGAEGLRVLKVLESAERSLLNGHGDEVDSGYYLHESSYVDGGADIGSGTKIWHFSHILTGSKIGRNCSIGQNVMIGPDVMVGDGCKVQNNVSLYKGVTLEDGVFCGPSCVFTNVHNPRAFIERKHEFKKTVVGKGATIGANATVVCGNSIGHYALVGAGAVVTRDVPAHAIVTGNPAGIIGWVCECGVKIEVDGGAAKCEECGMAYVTSGAGLVSRKA